MIRLCCAFFLIWGSLSARAGESADLRAQLDQLASRSTLYSPSLKPWHLKLEYTLYDDDGTHPVPGVLEEWWAAPDQDRITYTSGAFSGTQLRTPDGVFRTAGMPAAPYALEELHNGVVDPVPPPEVLDRTEPQPTKVQAGKTTLGCIILVLKGRPAIASAGAFPTYCFSTPQDELRMTLNFFVQRLVRNGMARFQGQSVATKVGLSLAEIKTGEAKVTALQALPAAGMDFSTAGLEKHESAANSAEVFAGRLLHQVPPVYPEAAKQHHIGGLVLLRTQIGKDGRVKEVAVRYSSSPFLNGAAEEAVKQWVYEPYLLHGSAVEVDTTVTVRFILGNDR